MTRRAWLVSISLLSPVVAHAQSAVPTVMSFPLDQGERVIVTRAGTPDTIRGRIVLVGAEGLVLDDGPTRHIVPLEDVQRVERRKDRFWNGALIGYAAGFAAGAVAVLATPCHRDPNAIIDLCFGGPGFAVAFGGLITGPAGFVVGGIGDALKRKPRVVFDRAAARVALAPTVGKRAGGLRVAVAF
jgi:hypothetical protein